MVPTPTPKRRRWPCALPSLLLSLLLTAQAAAQPATPTRADPLDPKAQVPSPRYDSAFAQFRRSGEDKSVAWREANDTVARIGGWRVYAREAQQPDAPAAQRPASPAPAPAQTPAPAPAPAAAKPLPAGHSGHKH